MEVRPEESTLPTAGSRIWGNYTRGEDGELWLVIIMSSAGEAAIKSLG